MLADWKPYVRFATFFGVGWTGGVGGMITFLVLESRRHARCYATVMSWYIAHMLDATPLSCLGTLHTCSMVKAHVPNGVSSRCNGKPNALLMQYVRQWQGRFENGSCLDLCSKNVPKLD